MQNSNFLYLWTAANLPSIKRAGVQTASCFRPKHYVKQLLTDLEQSVQFTVRRRPCRPPLIAMLCRAVTKCRASPMQKVAKHASPQRELSSGRGNQERDRWFESGSLQQRVHCEPDFLDQGAENFMPRRARGSPHRPINRTSFHGRRRNRARVQTLALRPLPIRPPEPYPARSASMPPAPRSGDAFSPFSPDFAPLRAASDRPFRDDDDSR